MVRFCGDRGDFRAAQRNLKLEGTFSGNLIFVDPDALESFSLK